MATFCYQRPQPRTSARQVQAGSASMLLLLVLAIASVLVEGASSPSPSSLSLRLRIRSLGYGALPNLSPSVTASAPALLRQRRTSVGGVDRRRRAGGLAHSVGRGGSAAAAGRRLHFWEALICGAISRSTAQTIMHPANTMKTILQSSRKAPGQAPLTVLSFMKWKHAKRLTHGAGAQLVLSLPHGAVNFAVLELVRRQMHTAVSRSRYADAINRRFGPGMDFLSSALSTVCCSVVSTPQMMICDNIMAGTYPNLVVAAKSLTKEKGISGFYTGWWPGIAGKIPSYGLTWTLFEQIKRVRAATSDRPAKDIENSIMGCMASAITVCVMIPMDTVKTRLVTQLNYPDLVAYRGISDCFQRVLREEGVGAFYRGLAPRLLSVVPMIGIQFGVYEATKKFMLARDETLIEPAGGRDTKAERERKEQEAEQARSNKNRLLQRMAMEVAADDDQPFPAPYPKKRDWWAKRKKGTQGEVIVQ